MEHTDKELLENYKLGWNDCANNIDKKVFNSKLMQAAYKNGWIDYIVGDDVRSVDYQTEEQILINIKKWT